MVSNKIIDEILWLVEKTVVLVESSKKKRGVVPTTEHSIPFCPYVKDMLKTYSELLDAH